MMGSEMGLLISPTEQANLWNSEFKIHCLGNFKCSCFIRGEMWSSCDALWRLKPEFSLSVRLHRKQYRRIMGMNSWMRFNATRSATHMPGLSMEEAYLPLQPFLLRPARDNEKIPKCFKSDSLESKQFLSRLTDQSKLYNTDKDTANDRGSDFNRTSFERDQPVEEPWLLQPPILSHYAANSNSSPCLTDEERILLHHNSDSLETKPSDQSILKFQPSSKSVDTLISITKKYDPYRTFCDRNQPVEEPWLFESRLFLGSDAKVTSKEYIEDEATHSKGYDQQHQVTEIFLPEEESNSIYQDDSVSKIILINSSACTMQRIAVLEDGKLVELLLEPVKNNVHSDSVYLGVVSKLVPNMDGAMVDIGIPRPALLRLYHNREPFLFPPFRHCTKEKKLNGHVFSIPDEQHGADEFQANSHDVEGVDEAEEDEIDDDSVRCLHDEYAEHDSEDDDDILEVVKGNVNGSLTGHGEVEAVVHSCSDQLDGRMDNVEGFFDNLLPSQLQDLLKTIKEGEKWAQVCEGTKIIVQVVKEGLGTKGPTVTAYPSLKSRFWVLMTRSNRIGISNKISGLERTRLRVLATKWRRQGFGLTVRTVAAGRSEDELQKDLDGLLLTWNDILEHAKSAVVAADEGVEGAIPVMLHRAMGQTLSVVQDYFSEKVKCMVVDSPRTYREVTNYLQEIAPDLCDRVELYKERTPLFDKYHIEEEMSNILCKRVPLANGGYLVIEQTEALVSIDVNGGQCMLGEGTSKEKAILEVNLAAAKQIARELRLRDIGGIIVVDFIDMEDDANKRLVYEEAKKAVGRDRSIARVSELSRNGLMEITRKRVRPSVTFMISEPCTCCHATGRVEALETSFSKIEREICRLLAMMNQQADPGKPTSWPRFILQVDRQMCNYLTSGKPTRLAVLSSSLKVWILLKVVRGLSRGVFDVKPLTNDKDNKSQPQVPISLLRRPTEVRAYTPREKVTIFHKKKRT